MRHAIGAHSPQPQPAALSAQEVSSCVSYRCPRPRVRRGRSRAALGDPSHPPPHLRSELVRDQWMRSLRPPKPQRPAVVLVADRHARRTATGSVAPCVPRPSTTTPTARPTSRSSRTTAPSVCARRAGVTSTTGALVPRLVPWRRRLARRPVTAEVAGSSPAGIALVQQPVRVRGQVMGAQRTP